jgi:hypothetical protein
MAMTTEGWAPLSIEELTRRFAVTNVDWWIAGGVAIDLFLGWTSRHHEDVDVEMFRQDRDVLFDVFEGWDLATMSEGELSPWTRGDDIADDVFGVWGRPAPERPWAVEVILASGDEGQWRFRRDPRITMGKDRLLRESPSGVRYCTPEVQLLYKAKRARPKDDIDLTRVLHLMTGEQKRWLIDALALTEPGHPWILVLESATRLNSGRG